MGYHRDGYHRQSVRPAPRYLNYGGRVRTITVGATAVALLACGWFVLSWRVMHTAPVDAAGEALGVLLGLLIVASVVGAVRNGSGPADADKDGGDALRPG